MKFEGHSNEDMSEDVFVKVGNKLGKQINEISLHDIDHLFVSIKESKNDMAIDRLFVKTTSGKEYIITKEKDLNLEKMQGAISGKAEGASSWVLIDPQTKVVRRISQNTMHSATLKVGENFSPFSEDAIGTVIGVDLTHEYSEKELDDLVAKENPNQQTNSEDPSLADALRMVAEGLAGTIDNIKKHQK